MSLIGKVNGEVEIKADTKAFHDAFICKPHRSAEASPDKVLSVDLHQGDWGVSGSVVHWNYVHDGKRKIAKVEMELNDDANKSMTYRVFEGDMLEEYKRLALTVHATAKGDGKGSVVHWTIDYEKLNEDVPAPDSFLHLLIHVTKDIDAQLSKPISA